MSNTRKPDYDVVVVTEFVGRSGTKKQAYSRIGSAWLNDSGSISVSIVTMPGVKLRLFKKKDEEHTSDGDQSTEPF